MNIAAPSPGLNGAERVSPPSRRVIASYTTYRDAQRAVDALADQKFPVQRLTVVADGLRFVEQVTGRLTWGAVVLNAAIGGAATGLFVGFLFGLFFVIAPLSAAFVLALYGLLMGLVIGALIGVFSYALSHHTRDFTSVGTLQADRYDLCADASVADEAVRLLALQPPD